MPSTRFYFDLGSPYAYLAAERLHTVLPEPILWQPILLGGVFGLTGRSSWALGDHERRAAGMAIVEARAQTYSLPPMRWPDPWPSDYLYAMRATTYAFSIGLGRDFTMRAFRDAFQGGVDLAIPANVLRAAAEVGIDAAQIEAAVADPQIKQALRDATDAAFELGVIGVPTFAIGEQTFWGDDRLPDAAAHLSASAG
ncbi:MAG TPA: DsbA family protein [Solirubrobacteraceae bacterium]|jgi:2-hydroxychromene-2-carboxylate isomerase|nr:DsbA family protein [Solirubrobacteraceae bacterium]